MTISWLMPNNSGSQGTWKKKKYQDFNFCSRPAVLKAMKEKLKHKFSNICIYMNYSSILYRVYDYRIKGRVAFQRKGRHKSKWKPYLTATIWGQLQMIRLSSISGYKAANVQEIKPPQSWPTKVNFVSPRYSTKAFMSSAKSWVNQNFIILINQDANVKG